MTSSHQDSNDTFDLLIVGGGPVGMTAALEAKRLGLSVKIVERKKERSKHDSRALVVHPRVMELLEPIGNGAVTRGIENSSLSVDGLFAYIDKSFWGCFKPKSDEIIDDSFDRLLLNMRTVEWGDTDYPNYYVLPQTDTEHILEDVMVAQGLDIDYGYALEDLIQESNSVTATLRNANDNSTKTVTSRWLLGCDGGRSKTRELVGINLDRHMSGLYFVVADIVIKGNIPLASHAHGKGGHVFYTKRGNIAFFPLPGENKYRLMGRAPPGMTNKSDVKLDRTFFQKFLFDRTGFEFELELGPWQSIFEITHGSTDAYRNGNVMVAGDASHVHSPVGGQGMNLGMQDANNILWKLSWAKRILESPFSEDDSAAAELILRSYHSERHTLTQELVKYVEVTTFFATSLNPIIHFLRNLVFRLAAFFNVPKHGFRKGGQLENAYGPESSSLIIEDKIGKKGIVKPGQRVPNIRLNDGSHLHSHIDRVRHTWIFLNIKPDQAAACGKLVSIIPAEFDKQISVPVISKKALSEPQVILVRPDQFVAGVSETQEELIDEVRKVGLTEKAIRTM